MCERATSTVIFGLLAKSNSRALTSLSSFSLAANTSGYRAPAYWCRKVSTCVFKSYVSFFGGFFPVYLSKGGGNNIISVNATHQSMPKLGSTATFFIFHLDGHSVQFEIQTVTNRRLYTTKGGEQSHWIYRSGINFVKNIREIPDTESCAAGPGTDHMLCRK